MSITDTIHTSALQSKALRVLLCLAGIKHVIARRLKDKVLFIATQSNWHCYNPHSNWDTGQSLPHSTYNTRKTNSQMLDGIQGNSGRPLVNTTGNALGIWEEIKHGIACPYPSIWNPAALNGIQVFTALDKCETFSRISWTAIYTAARIKIIFILKSTV